jgi:endogenous inhibitor of DNA gyrase (YacG/DUF329 family)
MCVQQDILRGILMEKKSRKVKTRCPRCGVEVAWEGNPNRPFCSEKCRLVDLGRWASEEYRIAGGKAGEDKDAGDNIIDFPDRSGNSSY